MASFTDSEKVEYALKTTLNITMSKFGFAPFNETPAPPRVFPSNVMSKDLITYGEGDIDENGAYVSGHSQSGNINTSLTTYESVLKYYKIVCPVTKRVSKAQLRNVLGTTSSQNILGREIIDIDFGYSGGSTSSTADETNFWTQPVNNNFHRKSFFRGHYIDESNVSNKFNYASSNYNGLNLAWNHIADGTDVSSAIDASGNGTDVTKIVPHLKLFLQVQTKFLIGADNKENQCFSHSLMKDMLGLDFKIPVQVNVGEVSNDPSVTAAPTSDITGPGVASGNEWYTQSTAGTINFYAVGHTNTAVDNARPPDSNPLDSSAPLVTFLKYTGDHAGVSGLGGGGGGGGGSNGVASTVLQNTTQEPSWTDDLISAHFDGNVGIGTTSPQGQLSLYQSGDNGGELWFGNSDINGSTSKNYGKISFNTYLGGGVPYRNIGHIRCIPYGSNYGGDIIFNTQNDIYGDGDRMVIRGNGNVGIGRTDPQTLLHISNDGGDALLRIETKAGNTKLAGIEFWTDDSTPDVANNASFPVTRILSSFSGTTYETGYLKFQTHIDNTTAYVDTMTIKGPNVGIGTDSPDARLHVNVDGNGEPIAKFSAVGDAFILIEGGRTNDWDEVGVVIRGMPTGGYWLAGVDDSDKYQIKYDSSDFHFGDQGVGLTINTSGDVGIGTNAPPVKFTVREGGDAKMAILAGGEGSDAILYFGTQFNGDVNGAMKAAIIAEGQSSWSRSKLHFCLDNTGNNSSTYNASLSNSRMQITQDGKVGIGMNPGAQLDVNGWFRHKSHNEITNIGASPKTWAISHYFSNGVYNGGFIAVKDERNGHNSPFGDGASFGLGEKRQGTYYLGIQLRGYTCYANTSGLGNTTVSDNRIKKDIEDVPDKYALQKVRDLPCRYYNYKHEPKNGEHKVVGFIAQEVKQHLPGCVNEGEMPSCMPTICEFVNVTWEKIGVYERDPSKNVFKIKCDEFEKYSNETHRFYFSNDGSINDDNVLIRETPKEEDNSFVITEIDEPYDYVYVYGASQSDFITIKKDQIFALHHSAIQEIDKQQQADKKEIAELKTKVASLESELAMIKQHLGL